MGRGAAGEATIDVRATAVVPGGGFELPYRELALVLPPGDTRSFAQPAGGGFRLGAGQWAKMPFAPIEMCASASRGKRSRDE